MSSIMFDGESGGHTAVQDTPMDLIESFQLNDFLFSSPHRTLLAKGCLFNAHSNRPATPETLNEQVNTLFERARRDGQTNPVVVGALPFDTTQPAHLYVPKHWFETSALSIDARHDLSRTPVRVTPTEHALFPRPQGYRDGVEQALEAMRQGRVEKIVLARTLEMNTDQSVDLKPLIKRLIAINPRGYSFSLPMTPEQPDSAPAHAFIGASPELLVRREGNQVIVNPLAGSIPRHSDESEDQRRASELAASDKDRREHALVIDAVIDGLSPYCAYLDIPDGPSVIGTDTLWHLSTTIVGELKDPDTTSLELAAAMHPTPAVCGHARQAAYQAIHDIEPFKRGYFAGAVGWCDSEGNGEWSVAIRCADVHDTHVRLYAGAGLVPGSDPQKELVETGTKLKTMLNAMGLDALNTL
ncbi:isochorismate synthase [Larsenimonas salina]|uniref:isochorismate synthase n=1 Tax=Larsenimonas salina TaxID=1295565 RepID=UPI00207344E2|nr:isochorismate synthase [Larsenimonas salina]MCM5704298.1 isochorismate synthase [Larsenimonas salina]